MDENIELPALLNIAKKLLPIIRNFNKYRYFLIDGGRGGAKSQSVGRFILYLAEKYRLRVVCGRETQNSINESVYSLLTDLVTAFNLDYDTQASKLTHREKGSVVNFRGFREQGKFNIQGMEGIDLLWIDEAQAITKQTLDVLIPTIRKDKAKIFFTMNRHVANDPVYVFAANRADCLHITINFDENEFCTNALKTEAAECLKLSQTDYDHIWRGQPLGQADDALFNLEELVRGRDNPHILNPHYGLRVGAFDIARFGNDKCAVLVLQQMGALHWEEVFCDEWDHKDLNYTTGRILATTNEQNIDLAAIDEDGLGAGPFDTLTKGRKLDYFVGFKNLPFAYKENKSFGNVRTANAYKVKDMLMKTHLCLKSPKLFTELTDLVKYTFDHYQRRILISKEEMKKKGFKSPNLADACIMAASLIGQVKEKQDRQYEVAQPTYGAPEENLLDGIP